MQIAFIFRRRRRTYPEPVPPEGAVVRYVRTTPPYPTQEVVSMATIAEITAKWAQRSQAAGPAYTTGITGKGPSWVANATAAAPQWAARIQEAIAAGSWSSGITTTGAAGWETATATKGPPNYLTGVTAPISAQKYSAAFGPILSAIQAAVAVLPPRGAPMSPENLARAQAIWAAVHAAAGGGSPGQMQMVQPGLVQQVAPGYVYQPAPAKPAGF